MPAALRLSAALRSLSRRSQQEAIRRQCRPPAVAPAAAPRAIVSGRSAIGGVTLFRPATTSSARERLTAYCAMEGSVPATGMINEGEFQQMVAEMAAYDEKREQIIKRSRDIQKNAKQAIFSLHRGGMDQANKQLKTCEDVAATLRPVLEEHPDLKYGSFSNSMEEYAEARVFKMFLEEGRLLAPSEIAVTRDEYLGGVLDFCGELNRYCIAKATVRDVAEVKRCRDLVEGLMAVFLQFDFRNGSLRKKFDSLKYTLKKMENTLYELALTEGGLGKSKAVDNDEGPAAMEDAGADD